MILLVDVSLQCSSGSLHRAYIIACHHAQSKPLYSMRIVLCCSVPEQKRAAIFACACIALVDVALLSALSVTISMCCELDCKCLTCFFEHAQEQLASSILG